MLAYLGKYLTLPLAAIGYCACFNYFFLSQEPSQAKRFKEVNQTLASIEQVVAYKRLASASSIVPELWDSADTPPVNEIDKWPRAQINKSNLCQMLNELPEAGLAEQLAALQAKSVKLGVCFQSDKTLLPTPGAWKDRLLSPRWLGPVAWLGQGIPIAKGYEDLYWSLQDHAWHGTKIGTDLFGFTAAKTLAVKISPEELIWRRLIPVLKAEEK